MLGSILLNGGSALSASFSGESVGRFVNAQGSDEAVVRGVGTAQLDSGTLRSDSSVPNRLTFRSRTFAAEEDVPFVLGTFEYSNGVTDAGSNIDTVEFEVEVALADGVPRTFTFPLDLTTTVNNNDPENNSDTLSLAATVAETLILVDGDRFVLNVVFGQTSEDGFSQVNRFSVFENSVATAEIVARISRVEAVEGLAVGVFHGVLGSDEIVVSGEGTESLTFGRGDAPNSFTFTGQEFQADIELPFTIGTFDYFNGTVATGTAPDKVDLVITLDVPGQAQETFRFPLNIVTTTNSNDREASADIVQLDAAFSARQISIGGRDLFLRLSFGRTTENGFSEVDRFFVFENESATSEIRATLTNFNLEERPATGLDILTAVEVRFRTFPGTDYQIQSSVDLNVWADEGEVIAGTGRIVQRFFSVPAASSQVFRVSETRN